MIYERRHTRLMDDFGGLAKIMPVFATFLMIATLASVAVPGTNGFVGEIMILVGVFRTYPAFGVFAVSGMVLGVVYMLWMYQKVMFGPVTEGCQSQTDRPEHQRDCDNGSHRGAGVCNGDLSGHVFAQNGRIGQ